MQSNLFSPICAVHDTQANKRLGNVIESSGDDWITLHSLLLACVYRGRKQIRLHDFCLFNKTSIIQWSEYVAGKLADSAMGHRSSVHLRRVCSTLAGRIRSVQMARWPCLWIYRMFRRRIRIRFWRFISGSFCRFSGKSCVETTYKYL